MNNPELILSEELLAATEALSESLLAAEPFLRYHRAQTQFSADEQARRLLEQVSNLQSKMRAAQTTGKVDEGDLKKLRVVQEEVRKNRLIMEYAQAQQNAISYLREINQEISELLGMDFAVLARQSCC